VRACHATSGQDLVNFIKIRGVERKETVIGRLAFPVMGLSGLTRNCSIFRMCPLTPSHSQPLPPKTESQLFGGSHLGRRLAKYTDPGGMTESYDFPQTRDELKTCDWARGLR
jgi:hypothetical protein